MTPATAPVVDAIPVWRSGGTVWQLHAVHRFFIQEPSNDLYVHATWVVAEDGRHKRFSVNVHEVETNAMELS